MAVSKHNDRGEWAIATTLKVNHPDPKSLSLTRAVDSTPVDAKPFQPRQNFRTDIPVVAPDLCCWQFFLLSQLPDLGPRETEKLHQLTSCHDNLGICFDAWRCRVVIGHCRLFLVDVAQVASRNLIARHDNTDT